jgi:hypothetical protein
VSGLGIIGRYYSPSGRAGSVQVNVRSDHVTWTVSSAAHELPSWQQKDRGSMRSRKAAVSSISRLNLSRFFFTYSPNYPRRRRMTVVPAASRACTTCSCFYRDIRSGTAECCEHGVLRLTGDKGTFRGVQEPESRIVEIFESGRPLTDSIMQEVMPRLTTINDSIREEIRRILTPEQVEQLEREFEKRGLPPEDFGRHWRPGPPPPR